MLAEELKALINKIQQVNAESNTIEVKSAGQGCPKRLYDTLSSFSNQDDGGIIVFGLDEENGFEKTGVYNAHDLQKKVTEQCRQMEPAVRPLFTVYKELDMVFVSAEIPSIDASMRPCYYKGKGVFKGSYIRVGESDEPMTDYEIYSYEAFRKKYEDEKRVIQSAEITDLDQDLLGEYIKKLKHDKPNLSKLDNKKIYELFSLHYNGQVTLAALLLFGLYPQAFCPQLSIIATVVPGTEIGQVGSAGERFLDNRRIEGTIQQMTEGALSFVRKNMRISTIIDSETGMRRDRFEYPMAAVRECILNALVHRDYSIHTEGMPVQVTLYHDRIEITSPGGLYGRIQIDQLGKVQTDTRNPVIANAMEVMGLTENRYSGIPTVYREMQDMGLQPPKFADDRGCFKVTLYNAQSGSSTMPKNQLDQLLSFCETPRSRHEIAGFLGIESATYAIHRYVMPLVEKGLIDMTLPEKPGSRNQRFKTVRPT